MKPCPHCQHTIEDSARFCIYCATSLDEKKIWTPRRRYPRLYKAITLLCVAALAASAVWLAPREQLPLAAPPIESTPVAGFPLPDSTAAESGTTLSSTVGSPTLTSVPTTAATKAPLLSFVDDLLEEDTTATAGKDTSVTPHKTTSSTTTAPTSKKATSLTVTTIPPTTTTSTTAAEPLVAGLPRIGDRYYTTPHDGRYLDPFGTNSLHTNPYYEETTDLYIEVVDVVCNRGSGVEISYKMCSSTEWQIGNGTSIQYVLCDPDTGEELYVTYDCSPGWTKADTVFTHTVFNGALLEHYTWQSPDSSLDKYVWKQVGSIVFIHAT